MLALPAHVMPISSHTNCIFPNFTPFNTEPVKNDDNALLSLLGILDT